MNGLSNSMGGLSFVYLSADECEAEIFGMQEGAGLVCISRAIFIKGEPAAFLQDALPENILFLGFFLFF